MEATASIFWKDLNALNREWLERDGVEHFKRTANNNYFNWFVNVKNDYFFYAFKEFLRIAKDKPGLIPRLLTINLPRGQWVRTAVVGRHKLSWFERKVYAAYIYCLHAYVKHHCRSVDISALGEPSYGNPLAIKVGWNLITQDLLNSVLEYDFMSQCVDFNRIKSVVEIGAGYGRLAWLLSVLHPHLNITIVDLPTSLELARHYLGTVLPESKVRYMEAENAFKDGERFDLCINISSFQEMFMQTVNHYYNCINDFCGHFYTKQWHIWNNPKDGITMPAAAYPTRPHWRLIKARQHPIHSKFFEAFFDVKNDIDNHAQKASASRRELSPNYQSDVN